MKTYPTYVVQNHAPPHAPLEMYRLGSDIWSQMRPSTGGDLKVTAPASHTRH